MDGQTHLQSCLFELKRNGIKGKKKKHRNEEISSDEAVLNQYVKKGMVNKRKRVGTHKIKKKQKKIKMRPDASRCHLSKQRDD